MIIMIMKMIVREKEKQERTEIAKYYCSPSDQCHTPSLHPNQPPFRVTSPVCIPSMTFYSVQYPFGYFGSPVLAMLLHSFFSDPPHWQSMRH